MTKTYPNTKTIEVDGGSIKRYEPFEGKVTWTAYDLNGEFVHTSDKGRTLRRAKAALARRLRKQTMAGMEYKGYQIEAVIDEEDNPTGEYNINREEMGNWMPCDRFGSVRQCMQMIDEWVEARMKDAFDRVKHPTDWRAPIDAIVLEANASERRLIEDAVAYYTGTPALIEHVNGAAYRVRATGYRMGPCGP